MGLPNRQRQLSISREVLRGKQFADDADVRLARAGVSRRHALIEPPGDNAFRIRDLQSTNGTFVTPSG